MTQAFPGYGAPAQQPQQQYGGAFPAQAPPTPQQGYAQPMAPAPQQGGFFQTQDPYVQAQQGPAVAPPQQAAPQQTADTSGFWGGAAAISFDAQKGYVKGTPRGGRIMSKLISNQTKLGTGEVLRWQDGTERKQLVVTLQTAERADPQDNGQRQLFIKGDMPRAVREAFQTAGASDIEVGGHLYVAWVDEKPAKSAGYNPQKIYKAVYAPPGSPDPMAGQPAYTPNPVPPVPQPSASPDQFAAHATYQQQAAQHQAAMPPQPQFAAPGTEMYPGQGQPQFSQPQAPQPGQFPAAAPQQPGQPSAQPPQPQQPAPPGQPQPGAYNPFA